MSLDLATLRKVAEAATSGPWQQGRFLNLPQYRNMPTQWKADRDDAEKCNVFHGFTATDQGRGREGIAETRSSDNAAYIAAFNPAVALELLDEIERLHSGTKPPPTGAPR